MFVDRYPVYPGDTVISEIEGIKIIDKSPPASINGVGTGCVGVVGEFLKTHAEGHVAIYNKAYEIGTTQELEDLFGTWAEHNNPGGPITAVTGVASPGLTPANWDGNGFLAVARRKFPRLVVVGVRQDCGTCTITATATTDVAFTIPAGTLVADADASDVFATLEDVNVALSDYGGHVATKTLIPIRRVLGTEANPTADKVVAPMDTGTQSGVTLDCTLFSAISDLDMAAMYVNAIKVLAGDDEPACDVNLVCVARHPPTVQGETVMQGIRSMVTDAAAKGRSIMGIVSPPLATYVDVAVGATDDTVGNGNVADNERVIYAYPGIKTYIPQIPSSTCGEDLDGTITWPFDTAVACVCASVKPEENPGQMTDALTWVSGYEMVAPTSGGAAAPLTRAQYVALRAAGIAAPKRENGTCVIQSGVTSAGPEYTIARRRFTDFFQASIADAMAPFVKQLATESRKNAILAMLDNFCLGLLSPANPAFQRIAAYSIDGTSGNTAARLARGIFVVLIKVQTLPSLDALTFVTEIGETVTITVE